MSPSARRLAATGVGAALLLGLAAGEPAAPVTPKTYWRAPEQTYLTYPEWFLVKAGKPFDMMIYPMRKHGIEDRPARRHLYNKMLEFWKLYL